MLKANISPEFVNSRLFSPSIGTSRPFRLSQYLYFELVLHRTICNAPTLIMDKSKNVALFCYFLVLSCGVSNTKLKA